MGERTDLFHRAPPAEVLDGTRKVASDQVMPDEHLLSDELRDGAREAALTHS